MAQRKYELAAAYVRVMPSMEGINESIGKAMSTALAKGAREAPIEDSIQAKVQGAVKKVQWGEVGAKIFTTLGSGVNTFISPLNNALLAAVRGAGGLFGDTLQTAASSVGLALTAAVGTVGTQIVAGGFNRALGINEATAGLKAMGYEGQQFTAIMTAAGNAVDGTAYSMDQSVLAARNFLAAGVPEEKLQSYLQNVGRLADIGTRSYDDISVMLQSMAATGIVQGGDMLQLAQAGIPIFSALSKSLGVSVAEVKKLGSDGKITFSQLNDSISAIDFDSTIFAATDVRSAFGNVRAQLSKIGANLWTPIIDKLPGILGDVRSFLQIFQKVFNFDPIQKNISSAMEKVAQVFDRFKGIDGKALDPGRVKAYVKSVTGDLGGFATKIKGFEGIIGGSVLGLSGGLLSQIPIIGPVFSRLTPVVGAFAGVLFSAFQYSKDLQGTIKNLPALGKTIQSKLFSKININGQDLFKGVGDGISKAILWVQDIIIDAVTNLADYMPQIEKQVDSVFSQLGEAFSAAQKSGLDGDAIAAIFKDLIKIFGTFVPLAFKTILSAATLAANVVKSDWFNTVVDWLAGTFQYFSDHSGVIVTGVAVAVGLFVGGKLLTLYKAMIAFIGKIRGIAPAADAAAASSEAAGKSFKAVFKSVGRIAIYVAAILAAMAGIGFLEQNTDFSSWVDTFLVDLFDSMSKAADGISNLIDGFLPTAQQWADTFVAVIGNLVNTLLTAIIGPALIVADKLASLAIQLTAAGASFIGALTGLTVANTDFLGGLINSLGWLAENGADAGSGALKAAAGMAALIAAVSGGSVLSSLGGLISAPLDAITGKGSMLTDLNTALSAVLQINGIASNLATTFNTAIALATAFGMQLPPAIAAGMGAGAVVVGAALTSVIQGALSEQQSWLDSNPLIVRMEADQSNLPKAVGSNGSRGSGSTSNTNNNYKITSNDSVIDRLLKLGRGY